MGFDPVPWFTEGGAQHSANLARVIAYMQLGGQEGVLGPSDLYVKELPVPGGAVLVSPGVCGILNRATGISKEAYIDRVISDDNVSVAPTDSSGPRSDMVIARVENPWLSGEPWSAPSDVTVGPYIFSRVIQGVPNTARTLSDAGLSAQSGIPLARIDIPASTATITQAMAVDLRRIANPLSDVWTAVTDTPSGSVLEGTTAGPTAFRTWPAEATWSVDIPVWATAVDLYAIFSPILNFPNGCWGNMKFVLNGTSSPLTEFDDNAFTITGSGGMRTSIHIGATMTVPDGIRGTTVNLHLEGSQNGTSGLPSDNLKAITGTNVFVQARWKQTPEAA